MARSQHSDFSQIHQSFQTIKPVTAVSWRWAGAHYSRDTDASRILSTTEEYTEDRKCLVSGGALMLYANACLTLTPFQENGVEAVDMGDEVQLHRACTSFFQ